MVSIERETEARRCEEQLTEVTQQSSGFWTVTSLAPGWKGGAAWHWRRLRHAASIQISVLLLTSCMMLITLLNPPMAQFPVR